MKILKNGGANEAVEVKQAEETMKKVVLVSGGFDPLHSGHIAHFEAAKKFGDKLIIAVNSDEWLTRKKGRPFMPFEERANIISNLRMVDEVWEFNDDDDSAIDALVRAKAFFTEATIVFCNGGDRQQNNIPEMSVGGIEFVFGVGGNNKANSSSWILQEWQHPSKDRIWGKYRDLFRDTAVKVKELIVEPGKSISYQRHFKRSEIWFVSKGACEVKLGIDTHHPELFETVQLARDQVIRIGVGEWHQIINDINNPPCHIVEIQYGEETSEEDIERLFQ
ncbi:MAG: adenylyltransferase/cytidyltransferase family protein [Pseudomonadales bacterium]